MTFTASSRALTSWSRSSKLVFHSAAFSSQSAFASAKACLSSATSLVVTSRSPSAVAFTSCASANPFLADASDFRSLWSCPSKFCFTMSNSCREVISALSESLFCFSAFSSKSCNTSMILSPLSLPPSSWARDTWSSPWSAFALLACKNALNLERSLVDNAAASTRDDKTVVASLTSGTAMIWASEPPFLRTFPRMSIARSNVSMISTDSFDFLTYSSCSFFRTSPALFKSASLTEIASASLEILLVSSSALAPDFSMVADRAEAWFCPSRISYCLSTESVLQK
mmetsp:Transcript_23072/g.56033  ORF Transcript_23072/g.56033 Transcript_23072/m.56033 type:complete len:284 (+) Transcript_23072:1075-1926(+)